MEMTTAIPNPQWLPQIRQSLTTLGLAPEWPEESIVAPAPRASRSADCALRLLAELGLQPDRLFPDLDGGVGLVFTGTGRYADLQFLNSGEVVATCSDRSGGTPRVWRIQSGDPGWRAAFETIRAFLRDGSLS